MVREDRYRRKQAVKERVAENHFRSPKEARHHSRVTYKASRKDYRTARKTYKLYKRPQPTYTARFLKGKLQEAKEERLIAKKVYQEAQERAGGSISTKIRRGALSSAKAKARGKVEEATQEDDVLGTWASGRQTFRQIEYQKQATKQGFKAGTRVSKFLISKSYATANKGYNFIRGNGFTRTPKELSWEGQLKRKMRNARMRLNQSKAGKALERSKKVTQFISRPLKTILKNPLSFKSYLLYFIIFSVLGLFMGVFGGSSPVQQNEFDLNRSWLHISKRDREKSTSKVDYWTNIDDILHYMNFRYGNEWEPDTAWNEGTGGEVAAFLGLNHFSDALNDIWENLNKDPHHLKTMEDLYGEQSKVKWLKLTKDELEDYRELKEVAKEVGRYPTYQELGNPFYTEEDEANYQTPLVVLKRFGYESKDKIYEQTQLKATTGQSLKAVMAGKVTIKGSDVEISSKTARFLYKTVGAIRVQDGAEVKEGDDIGTVKTNGYQEIEYRKLEEKETKETKAKWTAVNPGFYFQAVTYNQTTSVISDLNLAGGLAQRAKAVRDQIKKKLPEATDNGIAAMLGNFATESSIQAKRAEGDYLNPPIGATESSWDDENWLAMGGPAIYNGSYPNILHRGLGLGQWTDTADGSTRHTLLLNFAQSRQKKWYDLELQIDFMLEGDAPYYIQILKSILTSDEDVSTLTTHFLNNWEGNAGDKLLERQSNAKQMLTYFKLGGLSGGGTLASSWNFPEEYRDKVKNPPTGASMTTQAGGGYPVGECTWYAYNRLVELGSITDLSGRFGYLGNGQNWVNSLVALGWRFSATPSVGAVVSTAGGFDGTYVEFGHVGIVEHVNPDGSFLVSECNYAGVRDQIHWRVCSPALYYTFATPN